MNREQKMAWLYLATCIPAAVGFFVLWRLSGLRVAPAAFSVIGLSGLGPLIFRKPRGVAVEFDERDRAISRRASLGGFATSYLVFIVACMGLWEYCRAKGAQSVSIDVLPQIVFAGFIAAFFVRSVALLAMYRYGRVSAAE